MIKGVKHQMKTIVFGFKIILATLIWICITSYFDLSRDHLGRYTYNDLLCKKLIPRNILPNTKYRFHCGNLNTISIIKRNVGGGRSKAVDIGIVDGQKVVLKRISPFKGHGLSDNYRDLLFLKEILLRDQLDHPSLIKMIGYCVRHLKAEENYYKHYTGKSGIIAVYEYGEEFNITRLKMNSTQRLKHALGLADLIRYLSTSPLGPLILGDFNATSHFLMVDDTIKLIDFDYVHGIEYSCELNADGTDNVCYSHYRCTKPVNDYGEYASCNETSPSTFGMCKGINARINTKAIHNAFLKHLLREEYFSKRLQTDVQMFLYNVTQHGFLPDMMVEELNKMLIKTVSKSEFE